MRRLREILSLALPDPGEVSEACAALRGAFPDAPDRPDVVRIASLGDLLRTRGDDAARPLHRLLLGWSAGLADSWPLLRELLRARDPVSAREALEQAAEQAERRPPDRPREILKLLADRSDSEHGPPLDPSGLDALARAVRGVAAAAAPADEVDPVRGLFLREPDFAIRRLAAEILDQDGRPAPRDLVRGALGEEASSVLTPYLEFTRATHVDVLAIAGDPGEAPPGLPSLREAERRCGAEALRRAIAALGWPRLGLGLEVRRIAGIRVGGSLPLRVPEPEAALLDGIPGARRVADTLLFVAHGGRRRDVAPPDLDASDLDASPVERFRACNLAHAEVLELLLDPSPLDRDRALAILDVMGRIVADFRALFASREPDECALLGEIHADLDGSVREGLELERNPAALSPDLTRRVRMFEDPSSPGAIRTLHGLKRYLHQKGLTLGMRLAGSGRAADRTVDLLALTGDHAPAIVRRIRYADFEPRGDDVEVPPAVEAAVEPFARQLLEGNDRLPHLDVFCYGNEVHYVLGFRNHPALLRVNWAPPPWGGMIDLEYLGVSNYEVDRHPSPELDAIRLLLRELGLDVRGEGARIHARFDKEHASDPSALIATARAVLRVAPHLMDLDWTIGALPLDAEARGRVAAAWARAFARWGAIPFPRLLTRDRRAVLEAVETGPLGEREIPWDGRGPCPEGAGAPLPAGAVQVLRERARSLGIEAPLDAGSPDDEDLGQVRLDDEILRPLHRAIARGEVTVSGDRLLAAGRRREQDAERFARILSAGGEELERSAAIAADIAPLERILRFRTTGAVDGREVQRAHLDTPGGALDVFVLRDDTGIARLAELSREGTLSARADDAAPGAELGAVLSHLDCPAASPAVDPRTAAREARRILRVPSNVVAAAPTPGERVVSGLAASPGRAIGTLLVGMPGRSPERLDGAILAAPSITPAENAAIHRAEGVVSTGGAVLSHAAMIARQFGKPALLVDGRWRRGSDAVLGEPTALVIPVEEYREEEREVAGHSVRIRRDVAVHDLELRDGDLVVLDADDATLRVLGRDPETLAVHDGLRALAAAERRLARGGGVTEVLALRGDRLRARRRLEQLLARVRDPGIVRHAVHELLLGNAGAPGHVGCEERARLLARLLAGPAGTIARERVRDAVVLLIRRFGSARARAAERIPLSTDAHEVLALRARAHEIARALEDVGETLRRCGIASGASVPRLDGLDVSAVERLRRIRERLAADVMNAASRRGDARLRHLLRRLDRIDDVLGTSPCERARAAGPRLLVDVTDRSSRERAAERRVARPGDGGWELHREIGWKAANLAEIARLAGEDVVPPWYAVTDRAFEEVMGGPAAPGSPSGGTTLREAIEHVLRDRDSDEALRAARIRALWERVQLPVDLVRDVLEAYDDLGGDETHVAVRSSTREEDAESAARAGEFDTFLFVRGRFALLQHLKRAWAGLWSERAIHNRGVLGATAGIGGGVIVQRMVPARVSGVAQTMNTATGDHREVIVNAGFGMGEGIVSGRVAADRITVAKDDDPGRELRFRCATADKTEQIVLDRRKGSGTVMAPTLSHQRLRPALDYVELVELVRTARGLEDAYGYPLDLEFALEDTRLWILQARPVAGLERTLRDSLERYPLEGPARHGETAA